MNVRVVTLNLENLANDWFGKRGEAAIRGLKRLDADVLCLQEVTVTHQGAALYDQAHEVADALGLGFVAFDTYGEPDDIRADRQDGLAIASRWPFRRVRDRRLPVAKKDPLDGRVVMLCRLMHPDGDLDVVTTHLAWRPEDHDTRLMQADLILDVFTREGFGQGGHRGILAGDFNATDDEEVIARICEYLRDAWRELHPGELGATWLRDNPYTKGWDMPDRRLDYIFVPKGVKIERAELALDGPDPRDGPDAVWPSDHCAVVVDLVWD